VHRGDFDRAQARVAAENAVRTSGIQLLGGFVLMVGAFFTARTFRLNREAQITDRFSAAVGHLGQDELATQLGGIYALEPIMSDSSGDQGPILEILCAFIRARAKDERPPDAFPPPEVSAALHVIGRRNAANDPPGYTLNLSTTNLCAATFRDGDYARANFWRSDLRSAFLVGATMQGAYLRSADRRDAILRNTDLRGCNLRRARLEGTELAAARFDDARYDDETTWPQDEPPPTARRASE
jgi:hypothetical protein